MRQTRQLIPIIFIVFLGFLAVENFLTEFQASEISPFSNALISLLQNLAGIGLFLLLFWHIFKSHEPDTTSLKNPARTGWLSFFVISTICILTVIIVNPRGLYGIRIFPQLANALKQEKIQYFNNLDYDPELIILGSSRSLTIAPAYIKNSLGLSAYNFGFSGVRPSELSLLGDLIFADQKKELPHVILFEISPANITGTEGINFAEIPIEFLPYMSAQDAANLILDRYLELFNMHQFSEAVYVLQYIGGKPPQTYWEVQPDGYSRFFPPDTLSQALERQLKERQNKQPCDDFDPESDEVLQKFVSLSDEKNTSIIFYYSPVHPTFKQEYMDISPKYEWCKKIFFDLLNGIDNKSSSIFFVDLSDPATAQLAIDGSGFYDGFHITPANAEKLIDYLAPTIQLANQVAEANREKQP